MTRIHVRRKPLELDVERWDGPGVYYIPKEHTKHKNTILSVRPGEYIAKASDDDWYPVDAAIFAATFDILEDDGK